VADVADFTDALERVAAGGTALDPEVVGPSGKADRNCASTESDWALSTRSS
jgi:hypothetical protein